MNPEDRSFAWTYNRKKLSFIFANGITVSNILVNIIPSLHTIWRKTIHIFARATFNFIADIGSLIDDR